jgi:catechol 2,3-dioxygenase-like lactoylglutathione lyase family enzyme
MIDHVSLGVRDLAVGSAFYERVLATIGYTKLVSRERTIGFGKKYPELWLNLRERRVADAENGDHLCLRARDREAVRAFFAAALAAGGTDAGGPGFRPEYHPSYYAAFVRDPDRHLLEVVTFVS